jgi:hypothetical protein
MYGGILIDYTNYSENINDVVNIRCASDKMSLN